MTAYSLKYAKENLERIAEETIENCDQAIVTLDSGKAVVMIPLEEYESWKETHYLLSSPANAERLRKAAADIRSGQFQERELIEP
ncbi:type II toxin-antitoxin system Phd/YefM family antitoxin [Deinococcus sp.]|uniref:type II toxin-antitoxin system Phd/YefM family antitoxin n=1 Tax=Deinococcus sp. TaxID=47478 RepID=UPI0025DEC012|nr:type II toxin-antitoxin system Phd/YefM family antitoxin [Deinococcus sp.]